ncbi:hypothetical protein V7793_27795 [Streptomyces sp. KLMMK]|uniref:Uncharacterized protein n=1 Tax=Streptomyces telluris TaxID=2720021 RepID=A0A9X2LLW5_9ACTN|nr:hypothetical protein [Streptomyces telluris]MCQ8772145.1 hypothetical protein [Streptomyces telluris]NJP82432.1 hypothetical protein [Streptomyces telluris]
MLTSTICAAVSAAGLGIAALTAYRRRFLAATRIAAFSLVPIGLVLTGIVQWLTDVVFKPSVWAGFGILALSALLFVVSRAAERRGAGGGRKERKAAAAAAQRDAMAPAASAPSLGPGRAAGRPQGGAKKSGDGEDFSDIEAILKKHGI